MKFQPPYLIYLGDAKDMLGVKTGQGIVDWRPEWALGQLRGAGSTLDLGIPDLSIPRAAEMGAKTFVIGSVSPGGVLPESWTEVIVAAIEHGMDIASGLHTPLESLPSVAAAAARHGRLLCNVRAPERTFTPGTGERRSGKRLLTVGTDCSVGKKYTALCIERELRALHVDADFCATGQTGIFIAGRGVAIDAVVADFISGAVEWLSPAAAAEHWDVIEGQGSLFHPSFAGVSLGLLHGAQPDAFVVCDEPTRSSMRNVTTPMPSAEAVIEATLSAGRLTNPAIQCVGVALNTVALTEQDARHEIVVVAERVNLPVTDPMRFGVRNIAAHLLSVC